MSIYIGNNNTAQDISKIYIGVNNTAKKVKKGYIGVNNTAKLFYSDDENNTNNSDFIRGSDIHLPSGYTLINYIYSDEGKGLEIPTSVLPISQKMNFICVGGGFTTPGPNYYILFETNASTFNTGIYCNLNKSYYGIINGVNSSYYPSKEYSIDIIPKGYVADPVIVKMNNDIEGGCYIKYNNIEGFVCKNSSNSNYYFNNPLNLLAKQNLGTSYICYLAIYNNYTQTQKIAEFFPCKINNSYGFWDRVSNNFFTNEYLRPGPDININNYKIPIK